MARCSHGFRTPVGLVSISMEFVRVSETLQDRVVPVRLEQLQDRPKNLVQNGIGVPDIKVERIEIAPEMQLRLIIQRAAPITFQAFGHRPAEDVAQGVEIEM